MRGALWGCLVNPEAFQSVEYLLFLRSQEFRYGERFVVPALVVSLNEFREGGNLGFQGRSIEICHR